MSADNVIVPEVWNDRWKREELLTRRPRIRRSQSSPFELRHEVRGDYRYPYQLKAAPEGFQVVYRRGRWRDLNEGWEYDADDHEDLSVKVRDTVAWFMRGDERVGCIQIAEYDAPVFEEETFAYRMDDEEAHMGRLADLCCGSWQDFTSEVAGYGTVVELQSVWMKPRQAAPGVWRPALDALLKKVMKKAAILIVHAFPEEYTGRAAPGDTSRLGFTRRQRAIVRWCERNLGLERFPGDHGSDGWMWRASDRVAEYIDPPHVYDPNWWGK